MQEITAFFDKIFEEDYFKSVYKIVFSAKRKKQSEINKVNMRPLLIRDKLSVQIERHTENKVFHENVESKEAKKTALLLLQQDFKELNVMGVQEDIQVLATKPENPRITINRKKTVKEEKVDLSHNRKKEYILNEGEAIDFLVKLGVMSKDGKIFHKHYNKFRQINRYLEIVDDVIKKKDFHKSKIRVIDFGCGKSYLTFALYYYLKKVKSLDVEIIGLDLKKSVIDFCSEVAKELGYRELRFMVGDIRSYEAREVDMVVSLHACDTATDYALKNAVSWGAKIILSVPCCQHELFAQIENEKHFPILKHGIIKDKFTEILTNGLRGLILEACGYSTDMVEFTSMEHTAKNVMIRAVLDEKASKNQCKNALNEYNDLKEFYKVSPSTDLLLSEVKGK